jgi:hypothetical protein
MNNKQLELLNEIKVKMFYDPSKTLSEQTAYERQLDRIFSKPETASKYIEEMARYKHEIIGLASFGAFFIPFIGPFLSLGLELSDAALYAQEGDEYMAGLSLMFSLIPFFEIIPGAKKFSRDAAAKILKKLRANAKLTPEEKEFVKTLVSNKKVLKTKLLTEVMFKILVKMPISKQVLFLHKLSLKFPTIFKLSNVVFKIGGVYLAWDTIAKYFKIVPGVLSNEEKEKIENIDPKKLTKVFLEYTEENIKKLNEAQTDSLTQYLSKMPANLK